MSNLFTDMTGIRTPAEYDERYGAGEYQKAIESLARTDARLRFFIDDDGVLKEATPWGLRNADPKEIP